MANYDSVGFVMQKFLDYLNGSGPEPTVDHLNAQDRRQVVELIESLRAGRGINPYASRPSLEQLLVGSEFEEGLRRGVSTTAAVSKDLLETVKNELTYSERYLEVSDDVVAASAGIPSHFLVHAGPYRLRVSVISGLESAAELTSLDPAEVAGPIYGRYPDTAGVFAMFADDELSSIAIDPFDSVFCIEVPDGGVAEPSTRRPILPLADAVRSYLEELAPRIDSLTESDPLTTLALDMRSLAELAAREAIDEVVAEGNRAKIEAKTKGLTSLNHGDHLAITQIVMEAQRGTLSEQDLKDRMKELSEAA